MKNYTFSDILESYRQKRDWEAQFPVSRYIFRPLSFPLTALLLRFTDSAPAVAWLGLAVGITASALLVLSGSLGPWPGVCGLAAFALLDATDGNIARTTKSVTLFGKMLDGMLGKIAEGIYMPALAMGLYLTAGAEQAGPGSWHILAAGFIALCGLLYSSIIETTFDHFSLQKNRQAFKQDITAPIGSSRYRGNPFYAVFINLHAFNVQVLLLASCAASGTSAIRAFIYSLAAFYCLRAAIIFVYYLRRAAAELA